jgi:Flp pilus assembly protein TadG
MAGGMVAIFIIAALVFDIGQNLLDRRNQQNTADAAALAGARFLTLPACKPVGGAQPPCPAAVSAAIEVAAKNGYTDGLANHTVQVFIPPNSQSSFSGFPGHIQVVLGGTRGSFFAGVTGSTTQSVSTLAVAGNIEDFSLPFALLALNETACGAGQITGTGIININADIQVNSTCDSAGALTVGGSGATVNAATAKCAASGTIKVNSGSLNCATRQEHVDPQLFPAIAGPSVQPLPATPSVTGGVISGPRNKWTVGDTCPGQGVQAATLDDPKQCKIQSSNTVAAAVNLKPGTYPGGLLLTQGPGDAQLSVYMEPGIYYIAGGGLEIQGNIVLRSVEVGGSTFDLSSATMGVLIYNTDDPPKHDACVAGTIGGVACIKAVDFATGPTSDVRLRADQIDTAFKNLLLFQDANASNQPPLSMEGHSSQTLVGTIYIPEADLVYTGTSTGEVLNTQIICDEFKVSGGGQLSINYDASAVYQFKGVGLVQ